MSHMHVFDTLAFAKKLRDAGYTEAQAEALVEALVEAQSSVFREMLDSTLATKDDLRQMRDEIVGEIREEMDARFQRVDERFMGIDARFKGIDARLGEVDRRFQGVETRLGSLENRVDQLGLQLTVRIGGMIMISLGILLAAMRYMT
jgi:chromosome segregation ATPase